MASPINSEDFKSFELKYKERIKKEFEDYKKTPEIAITTESRHYQEFKKQWAPKNLNIYEKLCNLSEKILNVKPDPKEAAEIQVSLDVCHLNVTPAGVKSFSFFIPIIFIVTVAFFTVVMPGLIDPGSDIKGGFFFLVFSVVLGLVMILPFSKLPEFLANSWRMRASNQMVLSIFYIVTYMRHTSNLENAIDFAAEHLPPPLSLDLKKVIWNVETQKYSTIKESLDAYLETWKDWNIEYIESMHLIESSLYETSESRRLDSLDKSLRLMLDETYEKMLHYAHNLQGPLTMLNMLGIVLPILGLVILPLIVSFMEDVKWYHLMALYNIGLPVAIFYLGRVILSTRPTGYGETDISENNPEIKKLRNLIWKFGGTEIKIHPSVVSFLVFMVLLIIGLLPFIIHYSAPGFDFAIKADGSIQWTDNYVVKDARFYFLEYKEYKGNIVGPFGIGASVLSLFITLAFGISIGVYYHLRSSNVMKVRNTSRDLEKEFAGALFQLGNRIGDGIPVEIAFSKVSDIMVETSSGRFFELVSTNITKMGMSVEDAIFDPKRGAITHFPSDLIASSMKVLVESSKKGPLVASQALINVSEYIKQIHRVDERLKDLMADTISSMQSQISFLTPAIAGIVIGITSIITSILGKLSDQIKNLSAVGGADAGGTGAPIGGFSADFFGIGLPTFYFQLIVGGYVVQIVYIMTIMVNGIMNGSDPLNERFLLGRNLIRSTILYCIISFIVMLIFNFVTAMVTAGINLG